MSTPNDNKRQQLISKLREMFQMDQVDLDFGIYRIMNAKRDEISQFLEQDLLPTLRTTLQSFNLLVWPTSNESWLTPLNSPGFQGGRLV